MFNYDSFVGAIQLKCYLFYNKYFSWLNVMVFTYCLTISRTKCSTLLYCVSVCVYLLHVY